MIVGRIVLFLLAALGYCEVARRIYSFYKNRGTDKRQLSFIRLFSNEKNNPTEELLTAFPLLVICLVLTVVIVVK